MIFLRRIVGKSMTPTLKPGQTVLFHQIRNFEVGQIVIAFVGGREVVKRIAKIENGKIYLSVDDKQHAHNGKYFASITDDKIEGVLFWPRKL